MPASTKITDQEKIEKLKAEVAALHRQSLETPALRNELNAKIAPKLELIRQVAARSRT